VSSAESATATAGGKVILLGEHAVVYGSPAIALGLDSGATACVRRALRTGLSLGGQHYPIDGGELSSVEPAVVLAFRALLRALGAPCVMAEASLQIPAGAGLGASAALGVALARAVVELTGGSPDVPPGEAVARAAMVWENVFHGNASGIDTAAAEHGGCLWFTRSDGARPLAVGGALQVSVAMVEPGASTRRMVEAVAERRQADRRGVDLVIDSIADLARGARQAISVGNVTELGRLMTQNHDLLVELGVSTPGLDQACGWAIQAGALGAKLTGAGGGGCVIALVDERTRPVVVEAWTLRGLTCFEARCAATQP
jgi:mevalonate kinase